MALGERARPGLPILSTKHRLPGSSGHEVVLPVTQHKAPDQDSSLCHHLRDPPDVFFSTFLFCMCVLPPSLACVRLLSHQSLPWDASQTTGRVQGGVPASAPLRRDLRPPARAFIANSLQPRPFVSLAARAGRRLGRRHLEN